MKEKIVNLGYTTYLQKEEKIKRKWTSSIVDLIAKHKVLSMCFLVITMCVGMNFWLIYNFVRIIEVNSAF